MSDSRTNQMLTGGRTMNCRFPALINSADGKRRMHESEQPGFPHEHRQEVSSFRCCLVFQPDLPVCSSLPMTAKPSVNAMPNYWQPTNFCRGYWLQVGVALPEKTWYPPPPLY